MVGRDIEPGLYRVTLSTGTLSLGMVYVQRSRDVTMNFQDIIANGNFLGNAYVEIMESDIAISVQGGYLTKIDLEELEPNIQVEVGDGIFLVGYDIAPGTYAVEITDRTMNTGYVARLSDVSMEMSGIIANSIFQGPGYVRILDDDFAVQVQGAKLTFVE
jgi:hypothetical protein